MGRGARCRGNRPDIPGLTRMGHDDYCGPRCMRQQIVRYIRAWGPTSITKLLQDGLIDTKQRGVQLVRMDRRLHATSSELVTKHGQKKGYERNLYEATEGVLG